MSFYRLPASNVCSDKPVFNHIVVSLNIMSHISLAAFKILSLCFSGMTMISLDVNSVVYSVEICGTSL